MAKVRFGGGVAEMRRSLEGNTFSRNKGGAYVRQRVRPTNPNTPAQIEKREIMSSLAKKWATELSQDERQTWIDFATLNPRIDVLGETIELSGIQMFISLNERLLIANQTGLDEAPINQTVQQLTSLSAIFDIGLGDAYNITFTPTLIVGQFLQIFSTPQLSQGISFIKNRIRLILPDDAGDTSPLNAKTKWEARFGLAPQVGAKIVTQARVINSENGAISVPLRADTTVVST